MCDRFSTVIRPQFKIEHLLHKSHRARFSLKSRVSVKISLIISIFSQQTDAELSKVKELNEQNAFLWESKSAKDLGNAEERIKILEIDNLALRKKNDLTERELQVKCKEV